MQKKFKCANSKCTTKLKDLEEVVQINPDVGGLEQYCLKNRGTEIDQTALMRLKIEVGKYRCAPCFEIFVRRKGLKNYYHLIDYGPEKESKEREEQRNEELRDNPSTGSHD